MQSLDIDTAGQQPLETHSLLHAGFVRLAMQQNADLVPVLCLGELSALRNFVDLPGMQVRALCCQMRPPSSQPFHIKAPVLAMPPSHSVRLLQAGALHALLRLAGLVVSNSGAMEAFRGWSLRCRRGPTRSWASRCHTWW